MKVLDKISNIPTMRLYIWFLEASLNTQEITLEDLQQQTGINRLQTLQEARKTLESLEVFTSESLDKFTLKITSNVHFPEVMGFEAEDIAERCAAADRMSDLGDYQVPDSPKSIKRRTQIELVQAIFSLYFPDSRPLEVGGAKNLLRKQPRSEEILNVVEHVSAQDKQINSPYSYVLMVIMKRNAQGESFTAKPIYSVEEQAIYDALPDDLMLANPFEEFMKGVVWDS